MSAGLPYNVKSQNGVDLSSQWLRENRPGQRPHGPRATGRTVENRVTVDIDRPRYDAVVGAGVCISCGSKLVKAGNPSGGTYMACEKSWECFHIGWREDENKGEERIIG